jgi:hypothetical protein
MQYISLRLLNLILADMLFSEIVTKELASLILVHLQGLGKGKQSCCRERLCRLAYGVGYHTNEEKSVLEKFKKIITLLTVIVVFL